MDSQKILLKAKTITAEAVEVKKQLDETIDFMSSVENLVTRHESTNRILEKIKNLAESALAGGCPSDGQNDTEKDSTLVVNLSSPFEECDECDEELDEDEEECDDDIDMKRIPYIRKISSGDAYPSKGMVAQGLVLGCEC